MTGAVTSSGPTEVTGLTIYMGPLITLGPSNSVRPKNLHGPMSGLLLHLVPFTGPVVFLVIINSLMCILHYTTIVKIKKETFKKIIYSVESMHPKTIGTM